MTSNGECLRALIAAPDIVVMPGVHDTLSALVAEKCGATPILPAKAFQEMGYAACVMPVTATHVVAKAMTAFYADLLQTGDLGEAMHHGTGFEAYTNLVGLPEQRAQEQAYLDSSKSLIGGGKDGS